MRKPARPMSYSRKKRLYARRIVRLCKAIARKDIPAELALLVEDHIMAKLSAPLMRRLVAGDWGRPMREAMKLTVLFSRAHNASVGRFCHPDRAVEEFRCQRQLHRR